MKFSFLLVLVLSIASFCFGQSADLDPYFFTTQSRLYPNQQIPAEKRTYEVRETNRTNVEFNLQNDVKVNGFTKSTTPFLTITVSFPFAMAMGDIVVESIADPNVANGRLYTAKRAFSADGRVTLECKEIDYKHYDLTNYARAFNSKQYNNEKQARDEAQALSNEWLSTASTELKNFAAAKANYYANANFGFCGLETKARLYLLESKKHPEFENYRKQFQVVLNAFASVKFDSLPSDLETKLQPAISYFESIPTLYATDDKKHKKIRYSAYYNLMKIYYHLDNYEKAASYADLLIKNDYDEKDGKKLLELIEEMKALMKKFNQTNNHFTLSGESGYMLYRRE